jgi:glucose-1-phosphate adenylyltransferase
MFDCTIRSGAVVDRSILDKEVVVGQGAIIGDGPDLDTPNQQEPGRLNTGITVVGKRSVIPRGARIGRNVRVAGDIRAADFRSRVIRSGMTVDRAPARRPAPKVEAVSADA